MAATSVVVMVMETRLSIKGLYAITPDILDTALLLNMVEASIKGGVTLVQYRNKTAPDTMRLKQAQGLLALCRGYEIPLIINDDVEHCFKLDADGVHLGGEDGDIASARIYLGENKIIGASCYNHLGLAMQAKNQGADYVAFGSCFHSSTKPNAVHASLEIFARAKHQVGLPTVAIGGITAENATLAIGAGADAIAVISGLWEAPDPQQAAQIFSNFFTQSTTS